MIQLADRLRDEADAYKYLEELRWPDGVAVCAHCGNHGATYIEPTNGKSRATRTGTQSQRRVWRCLSCRKQFSVITGTVMHGTKVPIRVWVLVIFEMCSSKNGVAAREIERKYGVCCRTAWHLLHRIRTAMANGGLRSMLRGVVVADETFIGGSEEFRHKGHRYADTLPGTTTEPTLLVPGTREKKNRGPAWGKTAVLTLIHPETGEARSRVIPDVTGKTLRKAIAEQVDMPNTELWTDELASYRIVATEMQGHQTVNHKRDQYARYVGGRVITTNAAENFFSQLKRSLDGTHHNVSRKHLNRYLGEFDYRYSTRKMTDTERMAKMVGQVDGVRLTYKGIKGTTV